MLGVRRIRRSRSDLCLKCLGTGSDGFIQYRARMKGLSLNEATETSRPLLEAAGRADQSPGHADSADVGRPRAGELDAADVDARGRRQREEYCLLHRAGACRALRHSFQHHAGHLQVRVRVRVIARVTVG